MRDGSEGGAAGGLELGVQGGRVICQRRDGEGWRGRREKPKAKKRRTENRGKPRTGKKLVEWRNFG